MRDKCWNMQYEFTNNWNDADFLTNKAAQTQAIMKMIEQLKKPKESGVDLTKLENAQELNEDYEAGSPPFFDDLGIYLSMTFQAKVVGFFAWLGI